MAEGNAERLRGMIEAFNDAGTEAALAYVHPEIAWYAPPEWLERTVYNGHEGLRELAASWGQNFEDYRLDLERVIELEADRAIALLRQRGRIRGSGAPVEHAVAWIAEFQDGKAVRMDVFFSWEAGLEAVGLEG